MTKMPCLLIPLISTVIISKHLKYVTEFVQAKLIVLTRLEMKKINYVIYGRGDANLQSCRREIHFLWAISKILLKKNIS